MLFLKKKKKVYLFYPCVCGYGCPLFKDDSPHGDQVSGVSWNIVMQAQHPFSTPILNPSLHCYLQHY